MKKIFLLITVLFILSVPINAYAEDAAQKLDAALIASSGAGTESLKDSNISTYNCREPEHRRHLS